MIAPAIFYCVWDGIFAHLHVWFFNEKYITGIYIFNLPIEEVLFFFVVPYCCVFIYECIRSYFPLMQSSKKANGIFLVLAISLLAIGLLTLKLYYTSYTSIFLASFIFIVLGCRKYFSTFNSTAFLIAYLIIIIPFLVVNGFLTAIPVITYNDTENLATRIYTIPIEDVFYGMLLVMMNVVGYEKMLKRNS